MKTSYQPLVLLFGLFFLASSSFAQGNHNVKDQNGLKQGLWIIYGADRPGQGFPNEGIVEEGNYKDDRKIGVWIKYHLDGKTPRLKANYVDGRPNGLFQKFSDKGVLLKDGSFVNKHHVGPLKIYDREGNIQQEKKFNDDGKIEGREVFYFPDGTIEYELNYDNGVKVGQAVRYYPNGDIKKIINYGDNGEILNEEERERVNPEKGTIEEGLGGPDGSIGITGNGEPFQRNGYNKLFTQAGELWMAGQFKNGKLWEGDLYIYDNDGLLEKIQVWRNGKYHSDGQLD